MIFTACSMSSSRSCGLPRPRSLSEVFRARPQRRASNTFVTIALAAAAGFCLIACSSSEIMRYRPSSALWVTYSSMLAASPLTRPSF